MIATLISDFGSGDNSVAIAKGLLFKQQPELRLIDISHEVPPYDLNQCSYLLKSAFRFFPEHTLHVSLFNVMHTLPAVVLLAKVDNQIIITADNGFLSFTFPNTKIAVWKYENSESQNFVEWLSKVAALMGDLSTANYNLKEVKLITHQSLIEVNPIQPSIKENGIECHILYVDRYGNAVLNVTQEDFERHRNNRAFSILIPKNQPLNSITSDHASVPNGVQFCMFNSAGYLEIGVKNNSAFQLLGLRPFRDGQLIYSTVKIEFR